MSRIPVRPYLVAREEGGAFSITVRTTRLNSQGYPLVQARKLDETFLTATKARSYLKAEYDAVVTDIATA